jgi:hypothetical protein
MQTCGQPALETLLALRHLVQTLTLLGAPFSTTRIRWMFGFQRRRERRCECEILFPKPGVFPQMSQTDAITGPRYQIGGRESPTLSREQH